MNLSSSVTLRDHLELVGDYLAGHRLVRLIGTTSRRMTLRSSSSTSQARDAELYWAARAMEAHSQLQSWMETREFASGLPLWRIMQGSSSGSNLLYELANAIDWLLVLDQEPE